MTPLTECEAQQLQPGDTLVCIHMEEKYHSKLEIGEHYTVDSFVNGWVYI